MRRMKRNKKGSLYWAGVVLVMIHLLGTARTAKIVGESILSIGIGKDRSYLKDLKGIRKSRTYKFPKTGLFFFWRELATKKNW